MVTACLCGGCGRRLLPRRCPAFSWGCFPCCCSGCCSLVARCSSRWGRAPLGSLCCLSGCVLVLVVRLPSSCRVLRAVGGAPFLPRLFRSCRVAGSPSLVVLLVVASVLLRRGSFARPVSCCRSGCSGGGLSPPLKHT